jgi:hypothetical protein
MNLTVILGAALMALLASLPALLHKEHWNILREFYATRHVFRLLMRNLLSEELGAVTVTYYIRGSGRTIKSTTPPTAIQASAVEVQRALVVFGAATDVQALFTHNWGLDASGPEYYDPGISWYLTVDHTYMPSLTFDVANTNVVKINKAASTGPVTCIVELRRDNTEA